VMSTTTYGLSAFHEPEAAGLLDPWWLASLPCLAALGWRSFTCLRDRKPEAAWWVFAAVSFAPVCGVIPLPFPLADRYLYFILPGFVGGALLAGAERFEKLAPERRARFARGLRVATGVVLVLLAARSFDRAHIWQAPFLVMADAVRHYPDGVAGKTQRASQAALAGDAETAVALLAAAHERGYNRLDHLLLDHYGPIQSHPAFVRLKRQWAREWIERLSANPSPSQHELQLIAQAHVVLDDLPAARDALLRAIEQGGPISENLEHDLAEVEREIRFSRLR